MYILLHLLETVYSGYEGCCPITGHDSVGWWLYLPSI